MFKLDLQSNVLGSLAWFHDYGRIVDGSKLLLNNAIPRVADWLVSKLSMIYIILMIIYTCKQYL